ncbi:hypothetical protein ACVW1C_004678 [Bradyrhizobium sp. USDA 4011]
MFAEAGCGVSDSAIISCPRWYRRRWTRCGLREFLALLFRKIARIASFNRADARAARWLRYHRSLRSVILLPPNAARVAEHSLLAEHCNHPASTTGAELNRMQLNADPVVQSACNTIVDDMSGTAA